MDAWQEGYEAGLQGAAYADNPHENGSWGGAWAFGCSEGLKERNKRAFKSLVDTLRKD